MKAPKIVSGQLTANPRLPGLRPISTPGLRWLFGRALLGFLDLNS
jgi:hypothetical protein